MKKTISLLTIIIISLSIISITFVDAAAYVKFDGIEGESNDADHKGWIELESFSHGFHQPEGIGSSRRRRAEVVVEDFEMSKELDKSGVKLMESHIKGEVIPKVEIHVTASYTDIGRVTYYAYELKNVQITSYQVNGDNQSEDERPTENFSLNFEEFKTEYKELDDRGAVLGIFEFLYNFRIRGRAF